ncbi:MAG TPA: sulfite exporter TauE/SafE family protein [Usitatibacter sp.]|nr:sulfite exporter TauE/SafE family protein [Usitatibacter sp.]
MPSVLLFSILAASAVVTSFISGILGMAGGMVLMGVLLALMPLPAAMMLHGITQLAANGWRALLLRSEVDWRVFRGYVLGALVALLVFIFVRLVVSKPVALVAMGLTPFATMWLPEGLHLNVQRRGQPFICGVLCAAVSLVAGVSGPILDIFFVRTAMRRHAVVATKALTQSFTHILKIFYFGTIISLHGGNVEPWVAVMMVALALLGTSLSRGVLERMNDTSFRRWTRWTVLGLGAIYLANGLRLILA